MKSAIFFLILFLYSFRIFGYDSMFLRDSVKGNFYEYFELVRLAETAILEDSISLASFYYKNAFSNHTTVFSIDLFNGMICALELEDVVFATLCGEKLVERGCKKDFFTQKNFEKYKDKNLFSKVINAIYSKKAGSNIDTLLKKEVIDLKDKEQKEHYVGVIKPGKKIRDEKIINEFVNFYKKNGYPTEKEVGVYLLGDTLILNSFFYILFLHDFQKENYEFDSLLISFLANGKMRPQEVGYILGHMKPFFIGFEPYVIINDTAYEKSLSIAEEDSVNIEREKLGLETIEEFKRKIIYTLRNPDFFEFRLNGTIHKFGDLMPENTVSVFVKYLKLTPIRDDKISSLILKAL